MWLFLILTLAAARAAESIPPAEREVLFQRAVEAARNEGLDRKPEVRAEIDRLLYREFLKSKLASSKQTFEPSPQALQASYERAPLIKVRHLALSPKLSDIETRFAKIKKSKSTTWGETLDYRGENQLPAEVYRAAVPLKRGEFARVSLPTSEHLVQLVDRKTFKEAFPPYLDYLRGKLRQAREHDFLVSSLRDLQEKP